MQVAMSTMARGLWMKGRRSMMADETFFLVDSREYCGFD
jgi:hypothetical protein